jgi:ketosteroid isomerase-like protein
MAITPATLSSKNNNNDHSSQLKTVLRYFELVETLDTVELGKLFADDFVQSTRPLSLGVPSRTKEEDLTFLRGLAEKIEGRRLEVRLYHYRGCGATEVKRWLTARNHSFTKTGHLVRRDRSTRKGMGARTYYCHYSLSCDTRAHDSDVGPPILQKKTKKPKKNRYSCTANSKAERSSTSSASTSTPSS